MAMSHPRRKSKLDPIELAWRLHHIRREELLLINGGIIMIGKWKGMKRYHGR